MRMTLELKQTCLCPECGGELGIAYSEYKIKWKCPHCGRIADIYPKEEDDG